MATIASPAAGFRWAFLYKNQKKESFLDSHVRFFSMIGGVWQEVVYDNMRNVVSRFIGRNDKEINQDLLKLANYYGFKVNTTNCFSGNEKGYVESAVKALRRQVFARRYAFESFEEAQLHLEKELCRINSSSLIEEEKGFLMPARAALELADVTVCVVDKYSFIRIANNHYSVPDILVGERLTVKVYPFEIVIYSKTLEVARHKRLDGTGKASVDIMHYLKTLGKKPAALAHSQALRCQEELRGLFEAYYADDPRAFICALEKNKDRPMPEIVAIIGNHAGAKTVSGPGCQRGLLAQRIESVTRSQLHALSCAFMNGGEKIAC
jgi:hypothetical protein